MIIYDEPAETYHASGAIGSSQIRAFLKSPRLFRDVRDGIAKAESPALIYGTNFHTLFLEPQRWAATVAVKEEGMSFATRDGKAWRDAQLADGKTIVPFADSVHLARMRDRMPAEIRTLFVGAQAEVTYRLHLDGLQVQCRFDLVRDNSTYDLKSIEDLDDIDLAIERYSYPIQKRWYQRLEAAETGAKARPFSFIFAEKKPPYRWQIVDLDADYDALADRSIDDALYGIQARMISNCWDDPAPVRRVVSPPEWRSAELDELTESKE